MKIDNHIHCNYCGVPLPEIEGNFSYWGDPPKCNFCLKKYPSRSDRVDRESRGLDRRLIEDLKGKIVNIDLGYKVTGKFSDFDDFLILIIEDEGEQQKKRYYPIYNIIEIEEIH